MRKKMHETEYRASRVCRVLGNPSAYTVVKMLLRKGMSPGRIAASTGMSLPLVSATLRTLRNVDVVRYETRGNGKTYYIKDTSIIDLCRVLEDFVNRIRRKNF
jgi:DNA-binding transcriptional regulator GbsR (MarR family)